MKKLIILGLLSACSAYASYTDCSSVCSSMDFDSSTLQCLQTIAGKVYSSEEVCKVCSQESFDSSKNECLTAAANKYYSPSVLQICANMSFDSQTNSCLRNSGTPISSYPRPGNCNTARLQRQIEGALMNLDNYNYRAVRNTLLNMQTELMSCQ